jgi:hypothetical protein
MDSFSKKITHDNYLKILLLVPILLIIVNKDWIYTNAYTFFSDEWIYTGYFINFHQLYNNFGTELFGTPIYFMSRLSWVLPGYFLHHLFSPLIANYMLHLSFLYIAIISLYLILKIHYDEKTGLFISVLFCCYSHLLWQMGSNYPDPAIVTYSLLTMLMLTLSVTGTHWKTYAFFAGIFYMCTFTANIFSIILIPFFCIYYFGIRDKNQNRSLLSTTVYVIAGCCTISIFFAMIYYSFTGDFFFLLPQIKEFFYLTQGPIIAYTPFQQWIYRASWLILPVIVLLGSIIHVGINWKKTFSPSERIQIIFQLNYILLCAFFIVREIQGHPNLQMPYYAIYLVPFLFLSFGQLFSPIFKRFTTTEFFIFIFILIFTLPFTLFRAVSRFILSIPGFVELIVLVTGILLTGVFLFLIITSCIHDQISKNKSIVWLIIFCLLFGCLNSGLYSLSITRGLDTVENGYLAVMDSGSAIREVFPTEPAKFWYNISEVHEEKAYGGIFHSVNSLYLASYSSASTSFPYIDKKDVFWQLNSHRQLNLVVLSTDENAFTTAKNSLDDPRWDIELIETKKIERGKIQFYIYFIQVKNRDG